MTTSAQNSITLTGTQKAALLILALPEEQSLKVLNALDDAEVKEISHHMANLGAIPSEAVEGFFQNFVWKLSRPGTLVGNLENTEKLLSKAMDTDKVKSILDDIRGPVGRTMWDKLSNVDEELLTNYLKNEYPQTVAVILSKIKSEHASKILNMLPENFAMEIMLRMLRMEPVQTDVLDDIERTLKQEFMNNLSKSTKRDPHALLAEMFNYMDRSAESRFLTALEERNPEAAERVKSLMFTFEDLLKIDATGIQTILGYVDKSKLPLALKGAPESIRTAFFANMSERAAKLLKEEMIALGMVRVRDVEEAQNTIAMVAKDLVNRGMVTLKVEGETAEQMIE